MSMLPFIVWILFFFPIMGAYDGLKISSKRIDNPTILGMNVKHMKILKSSLLLLFLIISILNKITMVHALILLIGIPLVFWFLHDGAYFYTRGKNETQDWDFTTSTAQLYTGSTTLEYSKRLAMFVSGLIFFLTSIFIIG